MPNAERGHDALEASLKTIHQLLDAADGWASSVPPTLLYNEGWMLRLVLEFESRGVCCLPFEIAPESQWFSEALLPSAFAPRKRGDEFGEGATHVDGVVGHCAFRASTKRGLELRSNATQFVVVEAKMFSRLSAGTTRMRWFDQASRTVACMAHAIKEAGLTPEQFQSLEFHVFAPSEVLFTHGEAVKRDRIQAAISRRVGVYGADFPELTSWHQDHCGTLLERIVLQVTAWECIIMQALESNHAAGAALEAFYAKCLEFNRRA